MPEETELQHEDDFWRRQRGSYPKFVAVFLALVLFGLGTYISLRLKQQRERAAALQGIQAELNAADYRAAMADTYGGTTPQETLQMYIDAVEKGDYVLASKYFIGDYQEKELESLQSSSQENIESTLSLLKKTITSLGSFSDDKKGYLIRKPLLVDFKLYPNGVWKIIEI
jgi:hypothetical protein